jgi:photosystem II stability/assembly factor-like uncharacterized protein
MGPYRIVAATARGLATLEQTAEGWFEAGRVLMRQDVTSVACSDRALLAGTLGGVHRSPDGGRTWWEANAGMGERHIRWLAFHPDDPNLAYAGVEPAAIFTSRDGGETWRESPEVALLRDRYRWDLPYSPEAGCVRGFAFNGRTAYAAVEVGGVLRSDDWGESWDLVPGSNPVGGSGGTGNDRVHADVHSVAVHPLNSDHVYAATGGGLYVSTDGGARWDRLYRAYCRAVWVDSGAPHHLILGPADSVDRGGRIERSMNRGEDWQPQMAGIEHGLDATGSWPRSMVERFTAHAGNLFAVLSDGRLLTTEPAPAGAGSAWQVVIPELTDIRAIALPGG